jgi:hypothetical protein
VGSFLAPKMLKRQGTVTMPANTDTLEFYKSTLGLQPMERRRRNRMRVHWPLRLHKTNAAESVETVTHDLSSDGFYCLARTSFVPGEALACTLGVPTHHPNGADRMVSVECRIRIVRVEATQEGLYGVGCRIEEYRLLHSAAS